MEISEDEDNASVTSTKKKKKPILPMGVRRIEHKEEQVTLTTAAEIEAQDNAGGEVSESSDEEGLFVGGPSGEELISGSGSGSGGGGGGGSGGDDIKIKKEPGDADAMDMDAIPEGIKAPDSPELKKKALVGEQKPKKKSAAGLRDPEAEALAEDLQRNLDLFTISGDDVAATEEGGAINPSLEGHMFLFQFPRVLPPLKAVSRAGKVKSEPNDDDVVMLNQTPAHIDLTQENPSDKTKVKKENPDDVENAEEDDSEGDELHQGGYLGDLIVRKSGRVELSWGGMKLEMMPGTQASFLSTVVLIEEADIKPDGEGQAQAPTQSGQMGGVAYGMGKIQGSFALAPAWGEEEEWIVTEEELEGYGV
mgnify:CR=1 FL=1